jgi:cysteine-rich repeat protein
MRDILGSSRWLAALVLTGVAGCFSDGGPVTGAGSTTGEATTSDESTTTPATDDDAAPTTCGEGCEAAVCGDGIAMPPEECDDGDDDDNDVCTTKCKLPVCGDGFVQPGEGCDAGPGNADAGACTLACQAAVCGDGLVELGVEACDDGNADPGDGCSGCAVEVCGDGVVSPPEACDDGNGNDADDCTNTCAQAVCGDGVAAVDATAPETCDDGNTDETDACTSKCAPPACGDGLLQAPDEECDDGNASDEDACTPSCERQAFLVFVTSESYPAAFGGVAGADDECRERAAQAGLTGEYAAWISDEASAAGERLYHSPLPYFKVGGGLVAFDWGDLVSGNLIQPIDRDETGAAVDVAPQCASEQVAWTGTDTNASDDGEHCAGWTTIAAPVVGQVGSPAASGTAWTNLCKAPCDIQARLYCFEQP